MALPVEESVAKTLGRYIHAADDVSARAALDDVFKQIVEPVVWSVFKAKLDLGRSNGFVSSQELDAEDLAADIRLKLFPVLDRMRTGDLNGESGIDNFRSYVRAVAVNEFRQYLRDKYPERNRLKNQVRYVLNNHPNYAIWRCRTGDAVCGRADWNDPSGEVHRIEPNDALYRQLNPDNRAATGDPARRLLRTLAALFKHVGKPVLVSDVVAIIGKALGIHDAQDVVLDEHFYLSLPSQAADIEESLQTRTALEQLWKSVGGMPVNHRRALLLNLRDVNGGNALIYLPILRIASVRTIAEMLEMNAGQFAALWGRLPLEDLEIAEILAVSRQQVINLRQSARAKLRRLLE